MQDELLQRHRRSRPEAANTGEVRPRAGEHLEYRSSEPRGSVARDQCGGMFAAAEFQDEKECYKVALCTKVGTADAKRASDWTAGLAVYDIANPAERRQIGFMPV